MEHGFYRNVRFCNWQKLAVLAGIKCIRKFLSPAARVITLIKPQFEVGVDQVGRGGVVRDESLRQAVKQKILALAKRFELFELGSMDSPILGRKGNCEILVAFEKRKALGVV